MTREVLDAIPRAYRREQSFSAYDESTLEQYPQITSGVANTRAVNSSSQPMC
jgi:hypothetical protein